MLPFDALTTTQALAIPLGWPPELDDRALLLKTYALSTRCRKNQVRTEMEASSLLASFHRTRRSVKGAGGGKTLQVCLAVAAMSYSANLVNKMCPLAKEWHLFRGSPTSQIGFEDCSAGGNQCLLCGRRDHRPWQGTEYCCIGLLSNCFLIFMFIPVLEFPLLR